MTEFDKDFSFPTVPDSSMANIVDFPHAEFGYNNAEFPNLSTNATLQQDYQILNDAPNGSYDAQTNRSICQQEDKIIQNQSDQLLMLIDIVNAYQRKKLETHESHMIQHKESDIKISSLSYKLQIILMILFLILIIILIYIYKKELIGGK
jgi:hypothetical protein